jgi:hypothetical protein
MFIKPPVCRHFTHPEAGTFRLTPDNVSMMAVLPESQTWAYQSFTQRYGDLAIHTIFI